MVFCTLFDSNYLDKGLVLYDSLKKVSDSFKLYVIAFDDMCYKVLSDIGDPSLIPISMKEFESDELLRVKKERSRAEYCWTCSSCALGYIIDNFETQCTYIDADMYFYDDPEKLLKEMIDNHCQVEIIEHRVNDKILNKQMINKSGKYCVEFNTFLREKNSRNILQWWMDRCIECCTVTADCKVFGDQKYLDDWPERFEGVHVIQDVGAGVAPWNIADYEMINHSEDSIKLRYKITGEEVPLCFYHFHSISYLERKKVDISVYFRANRTSTDLVEALYIPYLKRIERKRCYLEKKYGLDYSMSNLSQTDFLDSLKSINLKEIYYKLKGYTPRALLQYVWYRRNRKKDIWNLDEL